MDFSKKQEPMSPGPERRKAKGKLKSSQALQKCLPCTCFWHSKTDEPKGSQKPTPTGAPNSNHDDQKMSNKGRKLKEASTSNSHLGQSSCDYIQQMSDAIHIFYEPEPADTANLDILFFHGLECEFEGAHVRDAHISSWKSTGEPEEIWPREWLPKDFPQARIMSICYDCCMKQTDTEGRFDLYLIAENLLHEISWAREGRGYTPMVLVGHGFGGIVMKTICVQAQSSIGNKDREMFLESVRGFFFYATPHSGMWSMHGMEPLAKNEGPLVKWMREPNSESARLNQAFTMLWRARRYRWTIFGVGEIESTPGKQGLRVPEASARFGDDKYITVSGDHFSVCRPSGKSSNKYQHLTDLIRDIHRQAERRPPLLVPEEIVGVDALVTEILGKHMRDHRFVGFSGMGGVGKTTLAKLIFNRICARFEFSCFVEEIKQFPGTKDNVRRKVWEKMRCHGIPVGSSSGSSGGGEWSQVTGKSLFLVFDDVEDPKHVTLLKEIAQENGMEESRFVLTSRNAQRLIDCGYDVHTIRVDILGSHDAKKLFTTYAFPGQEEPPERFRKLVKQVVDGCEGLPLTLEVLGKYLRGKNFEVWAEIPAALRKCDEVADLEEKVWAKLRLSYDRLPSSEVQNMFLDIASVFILDLFPGQDAIMAWSAIYDGVAHSRLQILEDRALVTVRHWEDRKEFYMHEHLRRMGQRIARLEGRSFDLSGITSLSTSLRNHFVQVYPFDDHVIFQKDQELGKIVAHKVHITQNSLSICEQTCAFCVIREVWSRLTAIRYMQLLVSVTGDGCCNGCKNRRVALPSTLVLLRLSSFAEGDFVFSAEAGRNYIDDGIRMTLSLTGWGSLVKLDLSFCHNVDLGGLYELRRMRDLRIFRCNAVQNWPVEKLNELRNLERLELRSITEPFELPITFGALTSLQRLCISECKVSSKSVSSSLTRLTSLRFLKLDEVTGRQPVPNILGPFRQLVVLDMKCWAIADLVDAVPEFSPLRKLSLKCGGMIELPDSFGNFTNLKELSIACPIRSLPPSVSNLTRLQAVDLKGDFWTVEKSYFRWTCCVEIKGSDKAVLDGAGIQHLHAIMTKQRELELRCTHGASTVIVRNMFNLESLLIHADIGAVWDIFGDLQKLRSFELRCYAVQNSLVKSLRFLSSLEKLHLDCATVEGLPGRFGCFSTLTIMHIKCPSLRALPVTIGNFIKLTDLCLENLRKLKTLPESIGNLRCLLKLDMQNCAVESLPESLGQLSLLTALRVSGCGNLKTLPEAIGDLSSLSHLHLCESSLHSFPASLGRLSGLTHLEIRVCGNLKTLPESLGRLQGLTSLGIRNCDNLKTLPESLGRLPGLTSLGIRNCDNLKTLPESLGRLSALEALVIRSCKKLKTLPETIGDLCSLRSLTLYDSTVHTLPESLGQLSALDSLDLVFVGSWTLCRKRSETCAA